MPHLFRIGVAAKLRAMHGSLRSTLIAACIACGLSPAAVAASLTITPATPHSLDTVRVQVPSLGTFVYALDRTRVVMMDSSDGINRIQVAMSIGGAISPVPPPYTTDVMLGDLPEGAYHVDVVVGGPGGPEPPSIIGAADFTVAAKSAPPFSNLTDLWWNPGQPGWGLNIVQHASGKLFITWFVYGSDGRPVWYVMPDGAWTKWYSYSGDIYRTSGPALAQAFDPKAVKATRVGTGRLDVSVSRYFADTRPGYGEYIQLYVMLDAPVAGFQPVDLQRQPF